MIKQTGTFPERLHLLGIHVPDTSLCQVVGEVQIKMRNMDDFQKQLVGVRKQLMGIAHNIRRLVLILYRYSALEEMVVWRLKCRSGCCACA